MSGAFIATIAALLAVSLLGLPIGHAMIASSILYLALADLDMGLPPSRS